MLKFLNPGKVTDLLKDSMDRYEVLIKSAFGPDVQIVVTADWASSGHVSDSQHYLGRAVDFHVVGVPRWGDAWLYLERIPALLGIGVYPFWNNPGFHADVRPATFRARWWRDKDQTYKDLSITDVTELFKVIQ